MLTVASDKRSITGRDRLTWRKDGLRLLLFHGTKKIRLAIVEPDAKHPFLYRIRYSEATPMTNHYQPHMDRCFDIDEPTSDTPPRRPSNLQQRALGCGKPDAHRLAAVSQNGGWWNPTTQELIPILPEDHPDYPQNQEIIREAIRRWDRGTSK